MESVALVKITFNLTGRVFTVKVLRFNAISHGKFFQIPFDVNKKGLLLPKRKLNTVFSPVVERRSGGFLRQIYTTSEEESATIKNIGAEFQRMAKEDLDIASAKLTLLSRGPDISKLTV